MAAGKKSTFIDAELQWSETKLAEWKAYVDANPLSILTDRIQNKQTARGGIMPMVVASIEQQGKFIQDTMKNYLLLLAEVDKMRQVEEAKKVQARGNQDISPFEDGSI